jgi:hypothetical protein
MSNFIFNLNTELIKINELYKANQLDCYNIDRLSVLNKKTLFNHLLIHQKKLIFNKHKFKMEYYYLIFDFIVTHLNNIYFDKLISNDVKSNLDSDILYPLLVNKLTCLSKGQILLNKINHRLTNINLDKSTLNRHLVEASHMGTYMTFMFWLVKTDEKKIQLLEKHIQEKIFINSIGNSDDRLYKYILNNILSVNKLFFQQNTILIKNMIMSLSNMRIPEKYFFKRLKLLSQYISLVPYFKYMIQQQKNENIIIKLHKYYYVNPHTFESLLHISTLSSFNSMILIYHPDGTNSYDLHFNEYLYNIIIINILKTEEEKIMFKIAINLKYNTEKGDIITDTKTFEKIIINNSVIIIHLLHWNDIFSWLNNNIIKFIIKTLTHANIINGFVKQYNNNMLFFTKFLPITSHDLETMSSSKTAIIINKILHKLRLIIRRKTTNKIIMYKSRMFSVLNEIKTYEPNISKPVLALGSTIYQYKQQQFNNIPPRHIFPSEITTLKKFLIREKADGVLINNLPIGVFPLNNTLNNYQVKAEYIEELDLYLVFDIDIPNTTIIERYNILRQEHPYTSKTCLVQINSQFMFDEIINIDKENIVKFLNENEDQPIKWYPKIACYYVPLNNTAVTKFINNIIYKTTQAYKLFKSDGIIISPLNGDRELKVKPKILMSIDLLYQNKKWIDRDNNDWSHCIKCPDKIIKENKIYRCLPHQDTFIVDEYRYDKKHPNPYNIVDNIYNLIKYDWRITESTQSYYEKHSNSKLKIPKLISTIRCQKELLIEHINKLEPSINKNWLDLGCGKGKLVSLIKQYNPKHYLGLDNDVKQLIKALKYHNINNNIIFNPCDLSNISNISNKNKWYSITDRIKYDYVVANFSLMHFFNDDFWTYLNTITQSKTKFIFNLVSPPSDTNKWTESNSFLNIEHTNVSYKFEWVHDTIKSEPFISHDMLNKFIQKYNWKIICQTIPNTTFELVNFYNWWLLERC